MRASAFLTVSNKSVSSGADVITNMDVEQIYVVCFEFGVDYSLNSGMVKLPIAEKIQARMRYRR